MLQMQTANKKANFKSGLVGILAVASAFFTTACPPQPNKFSVSPLISPLVLNEGLPVEAKFKVSGRSIDDLVKSAQSEDYQQLEISKFSNDEILVTGLPIDYNKNGPSNLEVELTDLDGKKAYSKLPIEIVDTIDVTFFGFPNELHGKKGIPIHSISGDLLDDYSQFGNGLGIEITSPHYTAQNIVYKGDNTFSFSLIPKEAFEGETFVLIKGFDDEGNVEYLQIPMYITGFTNFAPVISAQNFSTKEGGQGSFGVNIIDDEDPLPDLIIGYNSNDFNLSHELVNENLVTIHYSAKDYYKSGPTTIKITAKDTKGAISEKIINVTIQPMTDLELNVLGQYLIVDNVVIGHNTVPLANAGVKVYKREINWVEKEEYGDLYHFRMGINSVLGELLYAGTTDSQGNIKFKVDPQKEDENLLYLVVENAGFFSEDRHYFGNGDIGKQQITLPADDENVKNWLYYVMCNNGFQPMDGTAYIPKANISWPHYVFPNIDAPDFVFLIEEGEYVSPNVINETEKAIKEAFGNDIVITYDTSMKPPYSNKFFIRFDDDPNGSAGVVLKALSNLIDYVSVRVGREYSDQNVMKYVITHETNHGKKPGSHHLVFEYDSHFGGSTHFSTYPYLTPLDKAMLESTNKMYPGDKFIFKDGKLIKMSFSVIDFDEQKIWYLTYVNK